MPCSPGMRLCASTCAHRRFVLDYVAERDAQAVRAEAATAGNSTELADYFGAGGRPVEQRWTFARWLKTHTGADYPYPAAAAPSCPTWLGDADRWLDAVA